jgi:RNA polymerase sigma-70 factor (ECF subfamily)
MIEDSFNILKTLVSQGDKDAFAMLFRKYYPKCVDFLTAILGEEATAEDIAQDVFMKLWRKRAEFNEIRSLDDYIFKACKFAALDHLKSSYVKNVSVGLDSDVSGVADPESADFRVESREVAERLNRIMSGMSRNRRIIFIMSRILGLSDIEIAERLGISYKTVANQISLAGKEIKEKI